MGTCIDDLRSDIKARFAEMIFRVAAIEKRIEKLEEKFEGLLERSRRRIFCYNKIII